MERERKSSGEWGSGRMAVAESTEGRLPSRCGMRLSVLLKCKRRRLWEINSCSAEVLIPSVAINCFSRKKEKGLKSKIKNQNQNQKERKREEKRERERERLLRSFERNRPSFARNSSRIAPWVFRVLQIAFYIRCARAAKKDASADWTVAQGR